MSFVAHLLQKIEEDAAGKEAIQYLINCTEENLSELLSAAWEIRQKNFDPELDCFYPGNKFPAISITGTQCALHCKHCNKQYLGSMISAETPEKLWEACKNLAREGAVGCLISGGYNDQAMLPFSKFLPTLKKIKEKTNLILNIHTGLVDKDLAFQLGEVGIDTVSFDIVGDRQTIEEIYGLNKTPEQYLQSLTYLKDSRILSLVPHICVGLKGGVLSGELNALRLIKEIAPTLIVLLGLIPTANTPLQSIPPSAKNLAKIMATARLLFPTTPLSLGCMRPGKMIRSQIDLYAIQAGINRIEIPTPKAVQFAIQHGLRIRKHEFCCGVPLST